MGTKETLLAIIPREDGILISTMYYEAEIKDLAKAYNKPEIIDAELKMAKALINSMVTPFEPSMYNDEYQIKLRELLETKIAGKEIVAAKSEAPGNVINLMDALKASIEQNKVKKTPKTLKSKSPQRKRTPKGA
jgi:DNA end-binding protein Ku